MERIIDLMKELSNFISKIDNQFLKVNLDVTVGDIIIGQKNISSTQKGQEKSIYKGEPKAFLTTCNEEELIETTQVVSLSEAKASRQVDLEIADIPFGSRSHFVINKDSFWNVNYVVFNKVKVIPTFLDKDIFFLGLDVRDREYKVKLKRNNSLEISVWDGYKCTIKIPFPEEYLDDEYLSSFGSPFGSTQVKWSIRKYKPGQIIEFIEFDFTLPNKIKRILPICFSLDIKITEYAILITKNHRNRGISFYLCAARKEP